LSQPWPELHDFAMSFDLNKVDDIMHHHIPYGEHHAQVSEESKQDGTSTSYVILHHFMMLAVLLAVIILIHAAQAWRDRHGGAMPRTNKERSEFKDFVRSMKRTENGVPKQVSGMIGPTRVKMTAPVLHLKPLSC
jgi:amyloid beta precursor protein binding protein 1